MKHYGLRTCMILSIVCITLLILTMTVYAIDDWQQEEMLEYGGEDTETIAISTDMNGNIYVIYRINDTSGEIYPLPMAKKYDGSKWSDMGSGYISEEQAGKYILKYDDTNAKLYLGMITINGVIHIYEYTDTWHELENAGRILRYDPQFIYYDFQVQSDGSLVVAYVDLFEDGRITSKVYKDNQWIALGETGFTDNTASGINLAVDPNSGNIYAATIIQREEVEVWMFANDEWSLTDNSNIDSGYMYWVKIEIGPDGQPILIYMDTENEWKTFAMIYSENSWTVMEPYPFSPSQIRAFEISMTVDGWPVVYFNDSEYENNISSMMYNGEIWEFVGSRGKILGGSTILTSGFDEEHIPYVLIPDSNHVGNLIMLKYGDNKSDDNTDTAETESTDEEKVVLSDETTEKSTVDTKTSDVGSNDESEDDSKDNSLFIIIISIVLLVCIIIIVLFIVLKRKKEDDDD